MNEKTEARLCLLALVSVLLFLAFMLSGCAYKCAIVAPIPGVTTINNSNNATTEVPVKDVANGNTVPLGAL